ncbi:DNA repair protein RAD52 homolog [Eumeta japonica]|uniref:DNA repair protein RAD52 homolog n=1 Tax=Eumeta variegata TaxID=151549 RepID=A0A4C1WK16_EUMVA|nr:DNA repair protein RAD52 homolog [Eumeta japonica]
MQRKPGFPVANCNIKMPDSIPPDNILHEEDTEQQQRRQQLINFGHSQWGFNNWSWSVSKQELDFVDFANGKYSAGVVAFVSVNIKSFDIHRDNIGYATCIASMKGSAIYQARKCAVTNALKETLLSFGGSVTTELLELLESHKNNHNNQPVAQQSDVLPENNQNLANKLPAMSIINVEPKNASAVNTVRTLRKDSSDSNSSRDNSTVSVRSSQNAIVNASVGAPLVKNASASGPCAPLVAKAHPMPANQPHSKPTLPANQPRAPPPVPAPPQPPAPQQPHHMRPNSNVSFVLQPVMGGMVGGLYAPPPAAPRVPPPPHLYPNAYYECAATPWHLYDAYERHHANVNLNFNVPPKNLVVNGRTATLECKNTCVRPPPPDAETLSHPHPHSHALPHSHYPPPTNQGCWIKPTIFYDGFWTEQKVKKWVAEQVEKQFPENSSSYSASSPGVPAPAGPSDAKT